MHGGTQDSIGGDMATMSASNDPVFWIIAALWDKTWADWQRLRPANAKAYGGVLRSGKAAAVTDVLSPFGVRVQDVQDTRSLCYEYQETKDF